MYAPFPLIIISHTATSPHCFSYFIFLYDMFPDFLAAFVVGYPTHGFSQESKICYIKIHFSRAAL